MKSTEQPRLLSRTHYAILGLVGVVALAAVRVATSHLPVIPLEPVRDAVSLSTAILIESFPFIMLGILLSVVVRVWMPPTLFARVMPANWAARRVVMSFIGAVLPVCECGNVPLARTLLRQGLTHGDVVAFTLSAPLLNPVTIVTTYQAFGADNGILWGRVLGGFVVAQLVALLVSFRVMRRLRPLALVGDPHGAGSVAECCESRVGGHRLENAYGEGCCSAALAEKPSHAADACGAGGCAADSSACQGHAGTGRSRMVESMRIFQKETAILMPPLIFGALVAGLIQVGVSRSVLLALGQDPVLSVLAMMALAFIVSICSSVDAFFALSLAAIFTPGALIAFLIFGAMVDVKMLLLLRTAFPSGVLVRLVVGVTFLCACIGMGVNLGGLAG